MMYRRGSLKPSPASYPSGRVSGSSEKRAVASVVPGVGRKQSSASDIQVGLPEVRDPMFSPETFYLANDLRTFNRWIRYYLTFHPIIANSIDIHSYFPISDFSLMGVSDPSVLNWYTMIKEDKLKLFDWVILISAEYESLGEGFTFFGWDSYEGYYNSATVLNPDLLDVYPYDMDGRRQFIISMDIPNDLEMLYHKKDYDTRFRSAWLRLDPIIRRCVESGYRIPLNSNNVFGIQRLAFAYDARGTSQILRVIKDLMHEDKLREAQMAVADGFITPKILWKIGDVSTGYLPDDKELDEWRTMLANAQHQNLFQIVTHDAVKYETHGITDGLLQITPEIDKIEERILTALYTSKAMTTGEGPCVSADTEVLTLSGFKPFPEVTLDDYVASVNPTTHAIEYCRPKEIFKFDVCGPMYNFVSNALDHFVTPNHRCFVKPASKKEFSVVFAEDVKNRSRFMAVTAPFVGEDRDSITIGSETYSMCDYLAFAGLYLSEGSIEYSKKGVPESIRITQTQVHSSGINPRYVDIKSIVFKFFPNAVERDYFNKTTGRHKGRFEIYSRDLALHFYTEYGCGSEFKKIPSFVLGLHYKYLESLLNGMFLGDGSILNKHRSTGSFEIYTISKSLSDNIQEVALKCGLASVVCLRHRPAPRKLMYRVRVYKQGAVRACFKNPLVSSSKNIKVSEYSGFVYSLDLPPNRLYVSRRNGKVCVTGNTYSSSVIAMKVLEGRYMNKLYRIESIMKALYRKIAKHHDLYEATPAEVNHRIYRGKAERKLMVPKIRWNNHFNFSKDLERAKFYLELAKAHKLSYKRVLEVLGLDVAEESNLISKELNSVMQDPVFEARVKRALELSENGGVSPDNPVGRGVPTDFTNPDTGSGGSINPLTEAGGEVPEDASLPPLPDVEGRLGSL